jgi:HSP20 family molecular chaperone IbpA
VIVRDGVLTLKAGTKTEGVKYHLVERSCGSFQRGFTMSNDADGEKVTVEFKNGVLLVTVPEREEVEWRGMKSKR